MKSKKPKPRKVKIWCGYHGRYNARTKTLYKDFISPFTKKRVKMVYDIVPAEKYIRCPECNRRCKLDHVVADGTTYLFSRVSKHKKYVKR